MFLKLLRTVLHALKQAHRIMQVLKYGMINHIIKKVIYIR